MKSVAILLLGFLLTGQQPVPGAVESTFDKKTNFGAIKTYAWTRGTNAFSPDVHKLIVTAVEKEMAALGLTPAASGADVTVAYYSMALVNVDLKALDKIDDKSALATKDLGKLVVVMRNKANQQIWSAQSREFLDPDRTKLESTISTVTARLFAAYPTRVQK